MEQPEKGFHRRAIKEAATAKHLQGWILLDSIPTATGFE